MKRLSFLVSLAMAIGFASCMSIAYVVEVPEEVNYGQYTSYQVEEHCLDYQIGVNAINQQRIENAIFLHLREHGMKHQANGDLIVKYFVKNELKEFVEGCEDYYDQWEGGVYCVERIHTYTEGTLIVDIIDQAQEKVVWHGAVVGPVYDQLNNPNATIKKVINELLNDFDKRRSS